MNFFTSIVTSCKDITGKFRKVSAAANGIAVEDRHLMQQFGFASIPKAGSRILFLQHGNFTIAVATEGDDRPTLEEGESALYRNANHYIILKKDGSIAIKAPAGVDIDGDLRVKGDVSDSVGKLSGLRAKFNQHTHVGNLGAPTATPVPQDTGDADA
ncbi:MAG: hypothetical protein WCS18_11255 [Sphaerochaetaceae bacterium]